MKLKLKLICCEVFLRMACLAIADSPHTIDPEFNRLGAHEDPGHLRNLLQQRIDAVEAEKGIDAILLGYGLCGNATAGIHARSIPLIIPRAHDCCTLFLGSRQSFIDHFKDNLSTRWSSHGYMERESSYLRDTDTGKLLGLDKSYNDLVEQYGEENAQYVWETLHPITTENALVYIKVPLFDSLGFLDKFITHAEKDGKELRVLDGNMRLIHDLVHGDWNEEEFLTVPPGKSIHAVYDNYTIVSA